MVYLIMRIYEVPGKNRYEATEHFREALELGCEKDYFVKDMVKEADNQQDKGTVMKRHEPNPWIAAFKRQLLGHE